MKTGLCYPKEGEEQEALFQWAAYQLGTMPELELMHHIPNGGSRNKIEAARLKAQGVKSGVPDIFLPVARKGFHGLYIELKRKKSGVVSESQSKWLGALMEQGYMTAVCYGAEQAINVIKEYLK